ncbi:TAXI family TRAP transporter solute-binding subunit [Oscillibacter sp.]|uniref:TAXI family TRAP transporter solute-binding subunit n=1 Tax=Oscillibacter sp. TaxID=1945593 RepID=UPI002635128D|nr:TAXI family TRAP transporter solute-binding subunit [Oscillibacter sp.]MDD3347678.1 TAXI family TRAP transporter solute-binding subunit [Oscillibacter sp.]
MKKFLSMLLAVAMMMTMTACGGSKQEAPAPEKPAENTQKEEPAKSDSNLDESALYAIGGGATGGTFNAMGAVFTQFFNDGKVFGQFSATATTGGVQNVMFMENGTCDFGIVGQSVFVQAADGTDSFKETGANENLKIIAPLYSAIFQQFVGKGIKSEADLRGKKLIVGGPGSGDLAIAETLYGAMGMTFEDFEPLYLGSNEGAETMKDGHADGAIALTQLPFSIFVELTNADKAYLIPLEKSTIDTMCETNGHSYPSYYPSVIPADTYKNQTEELPTFATGTYFCCSGDLSDELVYELTKYMWENIEDLNTLHAAVANLTIDAVKDIADMPIHPGALKYYQEQGIL